VCYLSVLLSSSQKRKLETKVSYFAQFVMEIVASRLFDDASTKNSFLKSFGDSKERKLNFHKYFKSSAHKNIPKAQPSEIDVKSPSRTQSSAVFQSL
jgi:hypothetical protein